MATTVRATILSSISAIFKNATNLSQVFTGTPELEFSRRFGTSEISKCYFQRYTVTDTPTSVDLTNLTDAYGNALSFATVRHLLVINNSSSINLTVGGGTNGLFAELPFPLVGYDGAAGSDDGSCLNLTTNITVDGTHKILTLTATSGSISVDVFLVGA